LRPRKTISKARLFGRPRRKDGQGTEPHQRIRTAGRSASMVLLSLARLAEPDCSLIACGSGAGVHSRQKFRKRRHRARGECKRLVKAARAACSKFRYANTFARAGGPTYLTSCHRLLFCGGAFPSDSPLNEGTRRKLGLLTATVISSPLSDSP